MRRKKKVREAEMLLVKNGISAEEAPAVLKAIGLILLDRDIYDPGLENKQAICSALRDALVLTSNAGSDNALKELVYLPEKEAVRPVFEDGTGKNGYYDINVAWDSGTAMIVDVANQFISKMW